MSKSKFVAQNPLIMRCHRLMEAFAKSDDERDFYLDRQEGFLIYVDLDKTQEELDQLAFEIHENQDRYCPIPKLTFYEIKKVMEGFVNEKVYDIDTKEKLLDIIQSKEARENFLEFIYDHHSELEKWQQYYQERFRVRIIEWLRNNEFDFVFEEDLELTKSIVEKLKLNIFNPKAPKDILSARKMLFAKAKTYYSSEALNPRPKRGRPPKQVAKVEAEPQFSQDIYTTVAKDVKSFLFSPDYSNSSAIVTFSGKYTSEADLLAHRKQQYQGQTIDLQSLTEKLQALKNLSMQRSLISKQSLLDDVDRTAGFEEVQKLSVDVMKETSALKKKINGKRLQAENPFASSGTDFEATSRPKKATPPKRAPIKEPIAKKAAAKPVKVAAKTAKTAEKSTKAPVKPTKSSLKSTKAAPAPTKAPVKKAASKPVKKEVEVAPKRGRTTVLRKLRRSKGAK